MRDRHWEQLSQQLNMPLKPDKDFVLSKALDLHLMDHLDTIQKVSVSTAGVTVYLQGNLPWTIGIVFIFNLRLLKRGARACVETVLHCLTVPQRSLEAWLS